MNTRTEDRTDQKVEALEGKIDRDRTALISIGQKPGEPFGLKFTSVGEVMDWAKMMAVSGAAVPKHLRGNPGTCLAILRDALSWEMDEFKLARMSYVVNDMLTYLAQVSTAVMNSRAPIKGRISYTFNGEGSKRTCTASVTTVEGQTLSYTTPEFGSIQPKNSPLWKNDPDQQLTYFAGRSLCRRHFPDVLLGTYFRDEIEDNPKLIENVTYERVDNPLGGDDDEEVADKVIDSGPTQADEAGGKPPAETGVQQPTEDNASQGPAEPAKKAKAKAAKKPKEDEKPAEQAKVTSEQPPAEDKFPEPYIRQTSAAYTVYALAWIAKSTAVVARERWTTERQIRANLANPLTRDEQTACQEAMGRLT